MSQNKNNVLFNPDGQTLFKVMQGESYTVPETAVQTSPSGSAFNTTRDTVGGMLYGAFNDGVGPTSFDFQHPLRPGDVVACSAVASNVITVTITSKGGLAQTVFKITGVTTAGGVLGLWG